MNSLPKTVTRQRRGCDLNPGPSARESSTLTTQLPSHPELYRNSNRSRCRHVLAAKNLVSDGVQINTERGNIMGFSLESNPDECKSGGAFAIVSCVLSTDSLLCDMLVTFG